MNADDLRDVAERLEALEALAKLFGNSWLEYAKSQIQDEKIRAYLTVFDDAFPGLDHMSSNSCVKMPKHLLQGRMSKKILLDWRRRCYSERSKARVFSHQRATRKLWGKSPRPRMTPTSVPTPSKTLRAVPEDDARADAEENIEPVHNDEQAAAKKSTSNEEGSKDEDKIDAFFG